MLEKLTLLVREYTNNNALVLSKDMSIIKDLDVNSLDLVNLVVLIEDEFDVEIEDEEIKNLKTISDVMICIEAKL